MKKRKRMSRPNTLVFFATMLLILPFGNYFVQCVVNQLPLLQPHLSIPELPLMQTILTWLPFILGIGLLRVKKWAWYGLMVFTAILTTYNVMMLVEYTNWLQASVLLNTMLFYTALFYFLRKDIAAPYVKLYPRGWRAENRRPVEATILVSYGDDGDSRKLTTRDFSPTGFYADWRLCPLEAGQNVVVIFRLYEHQYELEAGAVRIDDNGMGVAFRGLSSAEQKELAYDIQRWEKELRTLPEAVHS